MLLFNNFDSCQFVLNMQDYDKYTGVGAEKQKQQTNNLIFLSKEDKNY